MRILILESYDGGSHGRFLDGLTAHSRHHYTRLSLPPRKWKWRMRGSAIYFAQQLSQAISDDHNSFSQIDLIFTSDMTPVADLRALLPVPLKNKPIVCYFHENQLTYPLPDESQRDYQYAFTNITSCLASDVVWFNSSYHRDSFLNAVDVLLNKMPDFVPADIAKTIRAKSRVFPLGLSPDLFNLPPEKKQTSPPTILWNHRWEYDKNPDDFFETLFDLDRSGLDFRLIVAGENFRVSPPIFAAAQKILARHIDHFSYAPSRADYLQLLSQADIVISTAIHEFFGLSVLEAIAARCYPLLPNRLSYPELLPQSIHADHLYNNNAELKTKLATLCKTPIPPASQLLHQKTTQLAWPTLIKTYDNAFENIIC